MALFKKNKSEQPQVEELLALQESTAGIAEELSIAKRNIEIEEAKDEAIFSSIGEGIIATDEKGTIIKVSNSTSRLLGYSEQDLAGKRYEDAIRVEDEKGGSVTGDELFVNQALGKRKIAQGTVVLTKKDGTKFPAVSTSSPIVMKGEVIGAIEVFRDITKEKEVDRMKTEFVSLASHQLKAPLTAIRGYVSMLSEGSVGPVNERQEQFLSEVFKSAENMMNLISDFLNLTKLEAGHLVIEAAPADIGALVEQLIEEVQPLADARKCEIIYEKPSGLPQIPVDARLFGQVIHNLLTNAVKYSGENAPQVTVKVEKRGEDVEISVADNGIGIPASEQDKIFGRLFRASTAVKAAAEGTGLGLYLAKQIVDYSGGKIWFTSEEGKGTTFFVSIPLTGMAPPAGS